jgi:hypothetical protein
MVCQQVPKLAQFHELCLGEFEELFGNGLERKLFQFGLTKLMDLIEDLLQRNCGAHDQ